MFDVNSIIPFCCISKWAKSTWNMKAFLSFSEHSARGVFYRFLGECQKGYRHRRDTVQRSVPVWPVLQTGPCQQPPGTAAKTGGMLILVFIATDGLISFISLYCVINIMPDYKKGVLEKEFYKDMNLNQLYIMSL